MTEYPSFYKHYIISWTLRFLVDPIRILKNWWINASWICSFFNCVCVYIYTHGVAILIWEKIKHLAKRCALWCDLPRIPKVLGWHVPLKNQIMVKHSPPSIHRKKLYSCTKLFHFQVLLLLIFPKPLTMATILLYWNLILDGIYYGLNVYVPLKICWSPNPQCECIWR